jgi:hypothetical protein
MEGNGNASAGNYPFIWKGNVNRKLNTGFVVLKRIMLAVHMGQLISSRV